VILEEIVLGILVAILRQATVTARNALAEARSDRCLGELRDARQHKSPRKIEKPPACRDSLMESSDLRMRSRHLEIHGIGDDLGPASAGSGDAVLNLIEQPKTRR